MSGRRALALLISLTVLAFAKEPKLKLTWIQAAPGDFVLAGKWASQRIVVTGKLAAVLTAPEITPLPVFTDRPVGSPEAL